MIRGLSETSEATIQELLNKNVGIERFLTDLNLVSQNNLPLINKISLLGLACSKKGVIEAVKAWKKIKDSYAHINVEKLDYETGRDIVEEMKPLVETYWRLLLKYQESVHNDTLPPFPDELTHIKDAICNLAEIYGGRPVCIVYKAYS